MHIDSIKFSLKQSDELKTEPLSLEIPRDLVTAGNSDSPLVFVICWSDVPKICALTDIAVDRGEKHQSVSLSRILLGRKRIPVVRGNFSKSGRLVSSIHSLICNAKEDRNTYIIGINRELFEQIRDIHQRENRPLIQPVLPGESYSDRDQATISVLNLMHRRNVPEALKNTYVGNSLKCRLVHQLILHAAESASPVMIIGDTGSGKEIVARQIHKLGPRSKKPLINLNCAAIPAELLELELFGCDPDVIEKGYKKKIGLWEYAGDGTLFLDEIGELRPSHQAKILRALEENKIRRVGGLEDIPVKARIITATNRDLLSSIEAGQFREDLYHRLRGFLIHTPALRDHLEDIRPIAKYLWNKIKGDKSIPLPDDIIAELERHPWPGNVRELKMVLTKLFGLYYDVDKLEKAHIWSIFQLEGRTSASGSRFSEAVDNMVRKAECLRHLHRVYDALRACESSVEPMIKCPGISNGIAMDVYAGLNYRLDELNMLCLYPTRFGSPAIIEKINLLKICLIKFLALLKTDVPYALNYFDEDIDDHFREALSLVLKEIEVLVSGIHASDHDRLN